MDSAVNDYANYLEHLMMNMLARRRGLRVCKSTEMYQFDAKAFKAMILESSRDICSKHRLYQVRLVMDKFECAFNS